MNAIRNSVRKPRVFLSFLFLFIPGLAFGQVTARIVGAVNNANRITLTGNVHPLARAEFDSGAVAPSQPMKRILLLLKRSDAQEAALQTFMEQQHDRASPNYHAWLTPSDLGALYGPADADILTITQWLEGQGFAIEKIYSGKTVIEFSGNAAQIDSAFGAAIHNYQVNGKTYIANANDPQIPAALAPVVSGIVSLNNFPRQSHARLAGMARKVVGQPGLQPLFTFPFPGTSSNFYGVGPADFATIYNSKSLIAAGNDGTGQTIGIVGETNINVADVQAFRQLFGLAANFDSTNVILNGEDPGITSGGEEIEADLDVQWSGAAAPGATIKYVVSASTPASQGIDLSALYIIEHNFAGVLSESYGSCEAGLGTAGNAFYNSLWEQAAAQGITAILSAGDGGSAGCDDFNSESVATLGLAVSGLASTPYNVALGGTDFDQAKKQSTYWSATNDSTTGLSALGYIPEIPWNENCAQISLTGCGSSAPQSSLNIIAGSGGPSKTYPKPKWQMGVTGMPNDSHRDLPDVSLFASSGFTGSGYIICPGTGVPSGTSQCNLSQSAFDFGIVGGTSASAPAFAGIMALVNQYQSAHGGSARQGNANYVLYSLAKKSGASCTSSATEGAACIFNDVTKGNSSLPTGAAGIGTNSVPCQGGSPNCSATVSTTNGVLVDPNHTTTEAWTATAGYDMATGLGSVNVNNLATNWHTVNGVATTTTLTLSPTQNITHGTSENVSVNVTVTPTSGTATGDVSLIAQFSDGTTQGLDQFTLASGKITATTNSLPGGTGYTVIAHYAGDGTNAPSDSAPVTVTVGKETSQTFIVIPSFDSSGNLISGNSTSVPYGSNYIIRMYVTDKNAIANPTGAPTGTCDLVNLLTCPSGTVTLTDSGSLVGTGGAGAGIFNLNSSGYTRNLSPTLLGGTHTLSAAYSGDNSYQPSTSATTNLSVTPAPTPLSLNTSVVYPVEGTPFSVAVNGTPNVPGGVAPTGTISLFDGTSTIGGPTAVSSTGGGSGNPFLSVSFPVTFATGGDHSLTASYSGDANYAPATSTPVVVHAAYPTTATQSETATNITCCQSITVTAKISSVGKSPPMTGQVEFYGDTVPGNAVFTAGTPGTDANGYQMLTATATVTPQATGYIRVIYAGDTNYAGSLTAGDPITVNIPDFAIGPPGLIVAPVAGQAGSGQITITPSSQTPSTVNLVLSPFAISGYTVSLSPQQVSLNGTPATATISMQPVSSPASAVTRQLRHAGFFAVRKTNWLLLSFVAFLGVIFVLRIPARRRRWRAALGLSLVSLLFWALGCGGGSGGGGGEGGGGGTTPQAVTITLTTSNAKVAQNVQFLITATVTSTSGKPLTGTVSFYNYGNPVEGGIPLSNGQAQTGSGYLNNPGYYQITATYSGDTYNLTSTSAPLAQVITGTIQATITGTTGGDSHSIPVNVGVQ